MLTHLVKKKKIMVTVKLTIEDYDKIKELAKKYTNNNLSEWIRYASTKMEPPKNELE